MGRATLEAKMKTLTAVILAAGESTRMRSSRPKALHLLGGRRLIDYPVRVARALGARVVLVVGRGAGDVRAAVREAPDLAYVEQKERLGTGHALLQARGACDDGADAVLVLPGDQPLMSEAMLRALVEHHRATGAAATLLTAEVGDPAGYGRVVREGGRPVAIVEHRDVPLRPRHDDDVLVVLRGGSEDRGTADVDLVEEHAAALARRRVLGERIEIHDDQVDRLDALALQLLAVHRIVAAREQRGMDLRMQRLDAPAEERRLSGDVLDRARRYALGGERGTSSVGGDELPPEVLQSARERVETCAIRDREEGSQRG